jgi:hypothetical protein
MNVYVIIIVLYLMLVMGIKLSSILQILVPPALAYLVYLVMPDDYRALITVEKITEHTTFKQIYPGYDKLIDMDFLKKNPIYLLYHLIIPTIIVIIILRVRKVYLSINAFLNDTSNEFSNLCPSSYKRNLFPLLIPFYNPILLLFIWLPLSFWFKNLPISIINSNQKTIESKDTNREPDAYISRSFIVYYITSVIFLYIMMFRACKVPVEAISEAVSEAVSEVVPETISEVVPETISS